MKFIKFKDWSFPEFNDSRELEDVYTGGYWRYFRDYKNAYSHTAGPFNLGICYARDYEKLQAAQYIGVMPLLPYIDHTDIKVSKDVAVSVFPRFSMSPKMMLEKVLESDDYFNNPDLLTYRDFSLNEIQKYVGLNREEKEEKILFGRIRGSEKIDFNSIQKTKDEQQQSMSREEISLLMDCYGIFEIIDFVQKCLGVCKKSVKKLSERTEENLNCKIKGRVLIQKQIKYNDMRGQSYRMYCSYNKMSEDNTENQILKYALYLCEASGCSKCIMESISYCKQILADVPLKKCTMMSFVGLKNNSAYRYYKDALNAAKLIIGRYGMNFLEPEEANAEIKNEKKVFVKNFNIDPFFIDMNYLFELYCRAVLEKAIEQFNNDKEKSRVVKFELESQKFAQRFLFRNMSTMSSEVKPNNADEFFMEKYIPDIVLQYQKSGGESWKIAAVLDAKWSNLKENKGYARARTHQILFYMCALNCLNGGLIGFNNAESENESSSNYYISNVVYNYPVDDDKEERKLMCYLFEPQNDNKSDEELFQNHVSNMTKWLEEIQKNLENE